MKIYRIETEKTKLYVKGVMLDTSGEDLRVLPIPTSDEAEAAWYEEDKAKIYCENMNQNPDITDEDDKWILKEVENGRE